MKTIGITGQYCSGLESLSEICKAFDYPIFEADLAIKFLLNWREDIMSQIRIQFGYQTTTNGFIDGSKFNTTDKFNRLLDIIDVDLMLMWEKFYLKHRSKPIVYFKSNILFERNWQEDFDGSIFIFMPESTRIGKIMKRLHISYNEAKNICANEMSYKDKMKKTTHVINNYDSLSLLSQFESINAQVLSSNNEQNKKLYLA